MDVLRAHRIKGDGSKRERRRPKFNTIFTIVAILCFSIAFINSYKSISFLQPAIPFVSGFLALVIPVAAQYFFSSRSVAAKDPPVETPVDAATTPVYVMPPPSTSPPATLRTQRSRTILGQPGAIESKTIQKRRQVVEEIYHKLVQPNSPIAIMLVGIADSGKTILASLIYYYAEALRLDGFSPFVLEPLWLQIDASITIAELAKTIFTAQDVPMFANFDDLQPQAQAQEFFHALNIAAKSRLVIFEDFDTVLDGQTGYVRTDVDLEALSCLMNIINGYTQPCNCRFLFTSRFIMRGTRQESLFLPDRLVIDPIDGLRLVEGIELLRNWKVKGEDTDLGVIVECCAGHPGALVQLSSVLYARKQPLSNLLTNPLYAQSWRASIMRGRDNPIPVQIRQLKPLQRKLLQAFSVYREPVPLNSALEILTYLETNITTTEIMAALDVLLLQCLLQTTANEYDLDMIYQPHIIVTNYIRDNFVEDDTQANLEIGQAVHTRAAGLYLQLAAKRCVSREFRQRDSNIHELIEAIWHYCRTSQWQEAYELMQQEDLFAHLNRWGRNTTLLDLYQQLLLHAEAATQHNWRLLATTYNRLGRVCQDLGKREAAKEYYEKSLNIYEEKKDSRGIGRSLNNLGAIWHALGDNRKAQERLKKALSISESIGDFTLKGRVLNNLGAVYDSTGEKDQAQHYYRQALKTYKEVGDREGEGRTLNNLGTIYLSKGQTQQAIAYYQQALQAYRDGEIEDWGRECRMLSKLAELYGTLVDRQQVQVSLEEALKICKRLGDRREEGKILNNLGAFYGIIGDREQALRSYEQALQLHQEDGDRREEAHTLNNLGMVYSNRKETAQAFKYYQEALEANEEMEDHVGTAFALCNLGLLYLAQCNFDMAQAYFELSMNHYKF